MISWKPTQVLLAAGLAGVSCVAAAPASAQFFGGGFFGGGPFYGRPVYNGPVVVDELDDVPMSRDLAPRGLPPRAVARIVNARGYQLTAAPMRAGERIIAQAADPSGRQVRFVIDAYDGSVLRLLPLDGARVAALPEGSGAQGLPGAQIDKFLPDDRPLLPKPKAAKPRAAKPIAKPPVNAALPQAVKPIETPVVAPAAPPVAATPVPAPSEATRVPAPIEQPATAAAPAPRAADIGPRVIPVTPAAPTPVAPSAPVEAAPAPAARVLLTEP